VSGIPVPFALNAAKFRRKKMHPYPWPIGTCHFIDLPKQIQTEFSQFVDVNGHVDQDLMAHQTATEGPYIAFCGYKIRVIIENITATTYTVKLA
jgi:hypothetical protein